MTGMNVVGDYLVQGNVFASSGKISTCDEKPWLTFCLYRRDKQAGDKQGNGKILMATVKGDVHDIGKNIVSGVVAITMRL
jgi:5-methyltetrahydrofolate--homocysteine methyltransferase